MGYDIYYIMYYTTMQGKRFKILSSKCLGIPRTTTYHIFHLVNKYSFYFCLLPIATGNDLSVYVTGGKPQTSLANPCSIMAANLKSPVSVVY